MQLHCATIFLSCVSLFISGVTSSHWNYDEQAFNEIDDGNRFHKWPKLCNTGKSQSPIDLSEKEPVQESFEQFEFTNYDAHFAGIIKNNGHTVIVKLADTELPPTVKGGGLTKEYTLDHLHFHWGSEHTVDDYRYPLEVHLVHFASEYQNLSSALEYDDGIAVLGVFHDLSPDDDAHFEPLLKIMDNVTDVPETSVDVEDLQAEQFLPRDTAGFYRYNGSLTTPGCDEVVTWTIFTNTLPISKKQVHEFELVHSDHGTLDENFRPVQKLNDREIYVKLSPVPHPRLSKESKQIEHPLKKENAGKSDDCNCTNFASSGLIYSFTLQFCLIFILYFKNLLL